MKQTKFLFDKPVANDWLFWIFVVLASLSGIGALQRVNESGGINTSTFSVISGTIDGLVVVFSTYILVIPIYLIRKFVRKRNRVGLEPESQLDSQQMEENPTLASGIQNKKSKNYIIFFAIGILAFAASQFVVRNSPSEGDKYFKIEQKISAVVKDWNIAVTPLSEAISEISAGSMGAAEARGVLGQASSRFAVITNQLEDACKDIPSYDVNAPGEDGAIAKSYDALQVTCDLLPQQSTEILLLVNEQISPLGSQANIDYHANQISILADKRKKAVIDSLDALMPYLSEAQKANASRLRGALT